MNFNELGLEDSLQRAVTDLGFEEPTVIQEKAIPMLLEEEKDLVGLAQTGTGKTAAFGLPLLQKVDTKVKKVQGLILSPTRELCVQIADDLAKFSKYKRTSVVAVYGGASIDRQVSSIKRGAQVVVATPGRLNDLIKRRLVDLSEVRIAVLDEADEMLNMGFKDELDAILSKTPEEKKTWLFSATMVNEVRRIASNYMSNPLEISAGKANTTNKNIDHQYVVVTQRVRYEALKRVLDFNPDIFAVIFCRTKRDTQEVADKLSGDGYNSDALHGDLSQAQRDRVMKKFRDKSISILVATDVAARGIDVNDVTHVIHHQLPEDVENYTHRSGRTARAGKKGVSVALVIGKDRYKIKQLEKHTGAKFTEIIPPTAEEICEKKLFSFSQDLNASEIDESVEKYTDQLNELFKDLSKEDLIKKVASQQMKALLSYYGGKDNLQVEDRPRRNENCDRFFINIGKMDQLDDKEMRLFLNESLGLEIEKIHSIDIKDSFSFFEYDKGNVDTVLATSDKAECNGRTVRLEQSKDRPRGDRNGGGRGRGGRDRRGGGGGRRFDGNRSNRRRSGGRNEGSRDNGGEFRSRRSGGDNRNSDRDSNRGGGSRRSSGNGNSSSRKSKGSSDFGFLDSSLTY